MKLGAKDPARLGNRDAPLRSIRPADHDLGGRVAAFENRLQQSEIADHPRPDRAEREPRAGACHIRVALDDRHPDPGARKLDRGAKSGDSGPRDHSLLDSGHWQAPDPWRSAIRPPSAARRCHERSSPDRSD